MNRSYLLVFLMLAVGSSATADKRLTSSNLLRRTTTLSGPQKIKSAEKMIRRMRGLIKQGFSLREQARKKNDIPRLNCVNRTLAGMRAMLRRGERGFLSLYDAVSKSDKTASGNEYIKMSIAYNKSEELGSLMRSCGLPTLQRGIDGKPTIVVTKDKDLPISDPVDSYRAAFDLLARPTVGSTTQ